MVVLPIDKKTILKTIPEVEDEDSDALVIPLIGERSSKSRVKRIFELSKRSVLRGGPMDNNLWTGYLYSPGFGLWSGRGERMVEEQEVSLEETSQPASSDGEKEEEWMLDCGNGNVEYPVWSNASLEVPVRSLLASEGEVTDCEQNFDVVDSAGNCTINTTVNNSTANHYYTAISATDPILNTTTKPTVNSTVGCKVDPQPRLLKPMMLNQILQ
uniref:Uncharacterized protein n=1 Tax=Ditylenchus dipsaci TaxID=166011 RepID=A0A915CND4_9BILA